MATGRAAWTTPTRESVGPCAASNGSPGASSGTLNFTQAGATQRRTSHAKGGRPPSVRAASGGASRPRATTTTSASVLASGRENHAADRFGSTSRWRWGVGEPGRGAGMLGQGHRRALVPGRRPSSGDAPSSVDLGRSWRPSSGDAPSSADLGRSWRPRSGDAPSSADLGRSRTPPAARPPRPRSSCARCARHSRTESGSSGTNSRSTVRSEVASRSRSARSSYGPVRKQHLHSAAPGLPSAASLVGHMPTGMLPPRSLRPRPRVALGAPVYSAAGPCFRTDPTAGAREPVPRDVSGRGGEDHAAAWHRAACARRARLVGQRPPRRERPRTAPGPTAGPSPRRPAAMGAHAPSSTIATFTCATYQSGHTAP